MNLELWKKRKKELKLTISDIANLSNLPKGSVQNIFCGYVPNPRTDTVEAIERALGITKEQPTVSPRTKEIVDLLMQLDDAQLDAAISVIKVIAQK